MLILTRSIVRLSLSNADVDLIYNIIKSMYMSRVKLKNGVREAHLSEFEKISTGRLRVKV